MGIAVTEEGTVFVPSSKEHGLYRAQQNEIILNTGSLVLTCGGTRPGHRDRTNSEGICLLLCVRIVIQCLCVIPETRQC